MWHSRETKVRPTFPVRYVSVFPAINQALWKLIKVSNKSVRRLICPLRVTPEWLAGHSSLSHPRTYMEEGDWIIHLTRCSECNDVCILSLTVWKATNWNSLQIPKLKGLLQIKNGQSEERNYFEEPKHKANQIATCAGRCGWPSRDYFNFSFVSDGWESDTSFLDQ